MNGDRSVIERGHHRRETRPSSVVAIFVPPPIFAEVQAVFDSPVIPDVFENVFCRDRFWVKTGDKITLVVQYDFAVISDQLTINSHRDFTIGHVECFSNVIRVV